MIQILKAAIEIGFHPFQGRAPFGPQEDLQEAQKIVGSVSIPFREELHSDCAISMFSSSWLARRFPSLSGKSSIRTYMRKSQKWWTGFIGFHPFQGRAPFGPKTLKFHSFEPSVEFPSLSGKSSIRTVTDQKFLLEVYYIVSIPFREELHSDVYGVAYKVKDVLASFPSLSGKSSIRTN